VKIPELRQNPPTIKARAAKIPAPMNFRMPSR